MSTAAICCLVIIVVLILAAIYIIRDSNNMWDNLPSSIRDREEANHIRLQKQEPKQLSPSGLLTEVALITESLTNTRHKLTQQMGEHHIQDFKDSKYHRYLQRELLKWQIMLGEEPFK